MAFNIQEFRSVVLANDPIRPSNFHVRFYPPTSILPLAPSGLINELEFWGEAAELPLLQHHTWQVQKWGYGAVEDRPLIPVYQEFRVTFIADKAGAVWRFFKNWQKFVVENDFNSTAKAQYELAYRDEYLADVQLQIYDKNTASTEPSISVTMVEAFPYAMGSTRLDWGLQNEIMRFPVSFRFKNWIEAT